MIASRNIDELYPPVKKLVLELIKRMKQKGYDVGVSSTYRDLEAQAGIYAQGRTAPGKIVSNAKPGDSMHNYRLAFDIFQNVKGKEYEEKFFKAAGEVANSIGLTWGGNFKSISDTPHFQWTDGLTIKDLKAGKMPVANKVFYWEKEVENTVNDALDILVKSKVVSSPDYWLEAVKSSAELSKLIIDFSKYIENKEIKNSKLDFDNALKKLVEAKIIADAKYLVDNKASIKYLENLIINMGNVL